MIDSNQALLAIAVQLRIALYAMYSILQIARCSWLFQDGQRCCLDPCLHTYARNKLIWLRLDLIAKILHILSRSISLKLNQCDIGISQINIIYFTSFKHSPSILMDLSVNFSKTKLMCDVLQRAERKVMTVKSVVKFKVSLNCIVVYIVTLMTFFVPYKEQKRTS